MTSKDILYQVSSDQGEVNSFYSCFSDARQKAPLLFQSLKKTVWYSVKRKLEIMINENANEICEYYFFTFIEKV